LPTRILDLGEGRDCHVIHLIESTGARGLYTALSYCWGPPDHWPLRTTNDNLQQHKNGIAIESLAKTYRDAITVTRSLGIRYLWVDALCIIQGDACDWKNECELMGQYYEKAHLVIAASGALNPAEGCFLPLSCFGDGLLLPFYSEGAVVGSFKIELEPPPESLHPSFTPLGDRAWATQEWWLSRRIVHFVAGTVIWSCVSSEECRFGVSQIGYPVDMHIYPDWLWLVSEYSRRSLSHVTDRLAAIQGLANEFKKTRQDDYVMGIWTGELPTALLWKVRNDGWDYSRPDDLSIFPSWSWAS
ncbi:HET-domain-containing protein, partial [Aspergillus sclerotioniger CBS 115572]